MKFVRSGMYRNCGTKLLLRETDSVEVTFSSEHPVAPHQRVVIRGTAPRAEGSSYYYRLELTPADVLKCLLTLPPQTMADAVKQVADRFDVAKVIPEILQHLAVGAIKARASRPEIEEEEEEEEVEEDDEEEEEADQEE